MVVGSSLFGVIFFIILFNISPCFQVIVLAFLYSCKPHSTSILEILETEILRKRYCIKNA